MLQPHPSTPAGPVQAIHAYVEKVSRWRLWVRYMVEGDLGRVAWPQLGQGGRADGLWRATCLEAFLWEGPGYLEYNFSPSGAWAAYRFDSYRQGGRPVPETASPACEALEPGARSAELEAVFERPAGAVRIGLSAVIEAVDGTMSYWALAHPSDKPDFHHPDSFVLELP